MSVRVAVVGGGIAGLSAAWELATSGRDVSVTVLEGSPVLGGRLRLAEVGGATVDVGAEAFLVRRPEAVDLVRELGLGSRLTHPAAVPASIVSGGRRWPMPTGTLMGVPADPDAVAGLLTGAEVDRMRAEVVGEPIRGDVAVGRLVDDRLGPAVTDKLVEPLLAGVYAGDSRLISAQLAVPALHAAAQAGTSLLEAARSATGGRPRRGGPVFATLVGGLATLPGLLHAALVDRGVQVLTSTAVRGLRGRPGAWILTTGPRPEEVAREFDRVVLATPAAPTARLLREVAPAAAAVLATVEYASMAIVTFVLDGPPPTAIAGHSGFLVPPGEPLRIKASTFSSVKWPWLAAAYPGRTIVRASIGRHREEASLQYPDGQLAELALADLRAVLGTGLAPPVDAHVQRWGGGLPQYAVGHRLLVERARAAAPPGLGLGGAAYDGVGIPACIGSGRAAARAVLG